jgi:predicted Rossmann fold nucleotide-binding protein DprA/Smf involved in DNA uptake
MKPTLLTCTDGGYPLGLHERLGKHAPRTIVTLGNLSALAQHKIALFCSIRCPGDAILNAYDTARKLRDEGVVVVSGFHSPVEKECLRILLRGKQPIIVCLARAMEKIRLPAAWRTAIEASRLLILSPFAKRPPRPTADSARFRNELVAALSDEVLIIHATVGGQIEQISRLADCWRIPAAKL